MTLTATDTAATDSFVSALRAHSQRYHDSHPFHRAMNAGTLNRAQIQGWVANRYCYQEAIPRKDAAILSNCPDREVRRRWIRRITDHDGSGDDAGGRALERQRRQVQPHARQGGGRRKRGLW